MSLGCIIRCAADPLQCAALLVVRLPGRSRDMLDAARVRDLAVGVDPTRSFTSALIGPLNMSRKSCQGL